MPEWVCTPTFTNKYIQHTTYTSKKSNKISCIKIQIFMFYSTSWQYTHITILVIMTKSPAQEIPAYLSSRLPFQTFESDFFHHIHSSVHSGFFLYILYSSTLYKSSKTYIYIYIYIKHSLIFPVCIFPAYTVNLLPYTVLEKKYKNVDCHFGKWLHTYCFVFLFHKQN